MVYPMTVSSKMIDSLIGQKIKQRRTQLSLSQADLGKLMGISAQQIQRYESGENTLNINRLIPLANFLNVRPEYFLNEVDISAGEAPINAPISRGLKRPLRIMLVEDDPNDILLFEKALERMRSRAVCQPAQKPDEVLKTLSALPSSDLPDIIILDLNMPRIGGIELLRQLKQSAFKPIPVVVMTNSVRAQDMLDCYAEQAGGFIQKSTDLYDYYRDIERIIAYWSDINTLPAVQSA